jgi:hypothetical protein
LHFGEIGLDSGAARGFDAGMNSSKTLQILSKHSSLTAAVLASNIDLSYNRKSAMRNLADSDKGFRNAKPVTEAYVVALDRAPQSYDTVRDGKVVEVWYRFDCDLKLLNKYTPFHGCLHDGPFYPVSISDNDITIHTEQPLSSGFGRKLLAKFGFTLCKL